MPFPQNVRLVLLLNILILPLLAGLGSYVLLRRPRQRTSWAFAGIAGCTLIFYLANTLYAQPTLPADAGFLWQRIETLVAHILILTFLALIILLRGGPLAWWERLIVVAIIARAAIDGTWFATVPPALDPSCLTWAGTRALLCPGIRQFPATLALIIVLLEGVLFLRTAWLTPAPYRRIVQRHLVAVAALGIVASMINFAWALTDRLFFPSQVPALLAIAAAARMLLLLDEEETGVRLAGLATALLIGLFLLAAGIASDFLLFQAGWPFATVIILGVEAAAGIAYGVRAAAQRSAPRPVSAAEDHKPASHDPPSQAAAAVSAAQETGLRVYLFGPLRVYQRGALLPNTAAVWRSAKTRSLLACLALYGERGVTQTQIVDVLWPLRSELDGDGERRSLTAFRSYLSTLRTVLEPGAPRGSERYVMHDDARYRLRRDNGLWVDAWAFEAAAGRAEAAIAAGQDAAGLAAWEEALNLYTPEGLLPDETHLLPEFLEPAREQYRQRWLRGLRQMARAAEALGQHERAAAMRARLAAADAWETTPGNNLVTWT